MNSDRDQGVELSIVDQVKVELEDIAASDLSEHPARYEKLHARLNDSLSGIDGL